MAARPVRTHPPKHPRLHIWGQLEARLQHADLLLLGGLNEGVWPGLVDAGPWLSASMRATLGLPPVERRIGLAAHDFVAAAGAGQVVLSRAEKDAQGSPTVPSRWLVRLRTLLAGAGPSEDPATDWQALARLDDAGVARPAPRPAPRPPLAARPRELSVSDVGLWMKDPYALYAKRILKLAPLEALEADPGALERGIIVHRVLERFVRAYPDALPDDALPRLLDLGRELFEDFSHRPQVGRCGGRASSRWRLGDRGGARAPPGDREPMGEVEGRLEIDAGGRPSASRRAPIASSATPTGGSRWSTTRPGSCRSAPRWWRVSRRNCRSRPRWSRPGRSRASRRPPSPSSCSGASRATRAAARRRRLTLPPAELAAQALEGLRRLVAHYDRAETAYPARPKPQIAWRGDYDHLARQGEWPI